MYKVSFILKKNAKTKLGLVSIRAYLPSGTFQASTGIIVPCDDWSNKTQGLKRTSSLKNAGEINQRLSNLKNTLQNFCISSQGGSSILTIQEVREQWKRMNTQSEPSHTEEKKELGDFIQSIIKEKTDLNIPIRSLSAYTNCHKHVIQFQKKTGKALITLYDESTIGEFTRYIITHPNKYANSYCHKIVSQLKTFLRIAHKRKIISDISFLDNKIPVSKKTKDTIYLTMSEIGYLSELSIKNKSLSQTRNLFLIGCLTGLRYSDYSRLGKENIHTIEHEGQTVEAIVMLTKKTKKTVLIPLTNPLLKELLERTSDREPISPQKFNEQLKVVAKLAGFKNKIIVNQFRGGKHEVEYVEKWQLFNSHLARRSFCTNAFKAGIPVQSIMLITGHSSVASFMQYLKIGNEEAVIMMSKHPFFNGK